MNSRNKGAPVEDKTDGLSSMTDSESSSTSSQSPIFDNQALILELHELQRDELPDNPLPEVKARKFLRKRPRRPEQDVVSVSSSLDSLAGSTVHLEPPTEEFFDARESYHGISAAASEPSSGSNLDIPKSIEDKSKTLPTSPSPPDQNTTPPTQDPTKASQPQTLEPGGTKARSPLILDAQDNKLQTTETVPQPTAPETIAQQTGVDNPAKQLTGPLTKPTGPTNP